MTGWVEDAAHWAAEGGSCWHWTHGWGVGVTQEASNLGRPTTEGSLREPIRGMPSRSFSRMLEVKKFPPKVGLREVRRRTQLHVARQLLSRPFPHLASAGLSPWTLRTYISEL